MPHMYMGEGAQRIRFVDEEMDDAASFEWSLEGRPMLNLILRFFAHLVGIEGIID